MSSQTAQNNTSESEEIEKRFDIILKRFDRVVDSMNIDDWQAVAWNAYPYPDELPRMLWQSEPVTQIFGIPINKENNQEERILGGKKEAEATLVVF